MDFESIAYASSATPASAPTIVGRCGDNPPLVEAAGRMEIIRELCSFERRLTGTDAERRASAAMAERLRGLGRRAEAEPIYVHPQSALVHAIHCLIGFAGSLVADLEPGARLRPRALRRHLHVSRPERPPLPRPQPALPSRVAEPGLPRRIARRPGPADRLRPPRRRPHRRRLLGAARALVRAPRPLQPGAARALPLPVLVDGGARAAARPADGGPRLGAGLGAAAPPHARSAGRRVRARRRAALDGRPRRQRQRLRGGDGDLARRRARGRATREPRRLGRARRRRRVTWRGHARVRARAPPRFRRRDRPSSSSSTPSARARCVSPPAPEPRSASAWIGG